MIPACLIILFGCNASKRLQYTGAYTVKEKKGELVRFFEVKGRYLINSDTLKKDDRITIIVVRKGLKF